MKRLYISDLDGTLLNSKQYMADETVKMLNEAINNGAYFTFATARTAASAIKIMQGVNVNVPCILMNGVTVYDIRENKYMKTEYISYDNCIKTAKILDELGQDGFMYKITQDMLICEYTKLSNPDMKEFYDIRRERYDKPFKKIGKFSCGCDENVVYFALLDKKDKLDKVRRKIEKTDGLKYEFYCDIYGDGVWYLEIFSDKASKFGGVEYIRKNCGFDEIVCFGDNLNDLPMFEASDIKAAVANAKDELKKSADIVIGSNLENSVAKYILKHTKG